MQPTTFRELLILLAIIFAAQVMLTLVLIAARKFKRSEPDDGSYPRITLPPTEDQGHCFQLYMSGERLFPAMLEAIEAATTSIYLETFIWKGDTLGQRFRDALERKAKEGVQVYVIYDSFANLVVSRRFFRAFSSAIHILAYPAFPNPLRIFDLRVWAREHRKLLVVDHTVAFVGGYNIGDLYHTHWRDTHIRVSGPVVANLAEIFASQWNRYRGRKQARMEIDLALQWQSTIRVQRNDAGRLVFPIRSMYLDAIERAERYIYLTNAYFIPDRTILEALVLSARRGVDVRILVPNESNHVLADWLARHYFEFCLRNNIRIFLYQKQMIHAKTATIDGIWSTVGTANLDRLSLAGNHEINLEMYSAEVASQMEAIFACDLSNAHELSFDEWIQRPWFIKAAELVLSPLWPML